MAAVGGRPTFLVAPAANGPLPGIRLTVVENDRTIQLTEVRRMMTSCTPFWSARPMLMPRQLSRIRVFLTTSGKSESARRDSRYTAILYADKLRNTPHSGAEEYSKAIGSDEMSASGSFRRRLTPSPPRSPQGLVDEWQGHNWPVMSEGRRRRLRGQRTERHGDRRLGTTGH